MGAGREATAIRSWRLDDGRQTLVLAARGDRLPEVVHWGAPLPAFEEGGVIHAASRIDLTGGMLDETADLSICPEAGRSFPGQPGMVLRAADGGAILPRFAFRSAEEGEGLCLTYGDAEAGLTYRARFAIDAGTRVVTASAEIEAEEPVRLDWLAAPVLPGPQLADEMIDVSGRWCGEFQLNRTPWSAGIRLRENRTGRTGHEHFPGLVLPGRGATNCRGEAWALHYGWSGGHRMVAEELPDGRRQVQFGHAAGIETEPATRFETAPLYLSYSAEGLNGCAVAFQRHLRDRIVTWPRPGAAPAGALQLLGGGLFRPRPRGAEGHRAAGPRIWARSASCSTTAGSAGATMIVRRWATGPWMRGNIPRGSRR